MYIFSKFRQRKSVISGKVYPQLYFFLFYNNFKGGENGRKSGK